MSNLARLSHHRWTLPVVAEIERTGGGRFGALSGVLGITAESLRRTLAALQEDGLVARNPGHGHPLRPEYLLTETGAALAPRARDVLEALRGHEAVGLKKWSLPVLAELDEPRRFSELRSRLPEATPRALTLSLKELAAEGLVRRTVTDGHPPSVRYEPTADARPAVRAARALGR